MKKILVTIGLGFLLSCSPLQKIDFVDKNATPETKALLKNLHRLTERGIMFGANDATVYGLNKDGSRWWYEKDRSDTKTVCGSHPAVFGWEIGDIELGHEFSLDTVYFHVIHDEVIKAYESNGINTIGWHLDNPLTGGSSWDTSSDQVVASIIPGGEKHELFKQWLDIVADFALSLKTADGTMVPVLFRPYHEHTGGWFWWGAPYCTVEEYVALWKFTVEYLRDVKGVHNFLYAYSPNHGFKDAADYLERYPGDDYVDILGFDCYKREKGQPYAEWITQGLDVLSSIAAEKGKLATFSEAGFNNIPEDDWWTEQVLEVVKNYKLSYVLVWRNAYSWEYYAPYEGAPCVPDFLKFYNDPHTLFHIDIANETIYQ